MLSKELETALNGAFRTARSRRHEFITVEHLLLALLDDSAALTVMTACNVDVEALRGDLVEFIDSTTPLLGDEKEGRDTQPTLGFQRVLQRAVFHVQSSGKREVTGANILVAVFSEQESQAVYFLKSQDVSRLDIVNFITHGIAKGEDAEDLSGASSEQAEEETPEASDAPLDTYATNLNEEARTGQIDPLIGRLGEVERVAQILARRRKNNPLLVGESGVGKTAIAEGLAKMIVDGNVPETLQDAVVYSLDLGALLAGTKYRGDFEKRFKGLLANLKERDHAILFIDEIHTIIGAGAASGGVMDASNLLKPLLSSGKMRCIGSTTYAEYRGIFDKDKALSRRFQKIDVLEPSVDDAYKILKGLKSRFEEHHGLRYSDKALRVATEMAARYITDRYLPDKAIDVIDEAGAYQQLLPSSKRKKVIGAGDIETVVAKIARIPPKTVTSDDKELLEKLEPNLQMVVFGQNKAVSQLVSSIKLARAGLREPKKPIGNYLFTGPTGVGKTEVANQLADTLGVNILRFDMSEYMEKHAVARLIGAPPGYVGHEDGGALTEAVRRRPYQVVLFDEIEKAHPDIFNILLQVLDEGRLTDGKGRQVDFRNTMILLTSNIGAEHLLALDDHAPADAARDAIMAEVAELFRPEFLNRLDEILLFRRLSRDDMGQIVTIQLGRLQARLAERGLTLSLSDDATDWLANKGYDVQFGARPLQRVIKTKLQNPLAEALLQGDFADGDMIRVGCDKTADKLVFNVDAALASAS